MKTLVVLVVALAGCADIEPGSDGSELAEPLERCADICADRSDWIKISLPGEDGRMVVSYSCPVEGALTPVICDPM